MSLLKHSIEHHLSEASAGINTMLNLPPNYDQTRGNRCDLLTQAVMNRMLHIEGIALRRELHQDADGNWHYILAHEPIDAKPMDTDLMSDLNPWQWRGSGRGMLHLPRNELMLQLQENGAPEHFVALRSIDTITTTHDLRRNPYSKAA